MLCSKLNTNEGQAVDQVLSLSGFYKLMLSFLPENYIHFGYTSIALDQCVMLSDEEDRPIHPI